MNIRCYSPQIPAVFFRLGLQEAKDPCGMCRPLGAFAAFNSEISRVTARSASPSAIDAT
jgi:hypothetical protein